MIGNKTMSGKDSTKFPSVFLGFLTDYVTITTLLNNFNLVVPKGEAPILYVVGSPSKGSQSVAKRYLWKLGSGTFSPIGGSDFKEKLELIDEQFVSDGNFENIISQPNTQEVNLGEISVSFLEFMNTTSTYDFTNPDVTFVITFIKDGISFGYLFSGTPEIYGLGETQLTEDDFIFIYQSENQGDIIDSDSFTLTFNTGSKTWTLNTWYQQNSSSGFNISGSTAYGTGAVPTSVVHQQASWLQIPSGYVIGKITFGIQSTGGITNQLYRTEIYITRGEVPAESISNGQTVLETLVHETVDATIPVSNPKFLKDLTIASHFAKDLSILQVIMRNTSATTTLTYNVLMNITFKKQ